MAKRSREDKVVDKCNIITTQPTKTFEAPTT